MEAPPEVAFRHADPTDEQRDYIRRRIDKLERYCDHITTCHVSVDREQHHAGTGDVYRARVRVHVPPNHEVIGEHSPTESKNQLDLMAALKDAFDSAERQLRRINQFHNDKAARSKAKRRGPPDGLD
jgi:ribosomal subunit interface protein